MRKFINIVENTNLIPFSSLYHATRTSFLPSIQQHGLLTKYYKTIHDGMEIHPPKPALYLSRNETSDNLHSNLWTAPVTFLKIDTRFLNPNHLWPDDFIYDSVIEGDILSDAEEIMNALGIQFDQAEILLEKIENANKNQLPILLKPFWKWYLNYEHGGEVAYTANIPFKAIHFP